MRVRLKIAAILSCLALGLGIGTFAQAPTNVLNPASDLAGKTLVTAEGNRTISGTFTWSVPVRLATGTTNAPGLVSSADTTTGWSLGLSTIAASISGTQKFLLNSAGLTIFGTQVFTSAPLANPAVLGTGTPGSTTYLRGDSTWQVLVTPPSTVSGPCTVILTSSSGNPTPSSDVTATTNVYVTPNLGSVCYFYDGSSTWTPLAMTEIAVPLGTITASIGYDVFCYNNSGTPACEILAWTSATARATAVTYQNGVLVKSGATSRRWMGSFYTSSTTTTEDTLTQRFVCSAYSRRARVLRRLETTASWDYNTATIRAARGQTTNRVEIFNCYPTTETTDVLTLRLDEQVVNGTGGESLAVGIGEDTTTAFTLPAVDLDTTTVTDSSYHRFRPILIKTPAVGYHYYSWNEYSTATGTSTFYGSTTLGAIAIQYGLQGTVIQ